MNTGRHGLEAALIVMALVLVPWGVAAQGNRLPRPDTVVKPRVYASLAPVPRGQTFEIAVVGEILPGFHINANKVSEDYLIPTTVESNLPAGFRLMETVYPEGALKKFGFSDTKLNVYDGTITVRLKIQAQPDAPLGAAKLPLTLRYQACNDSVCLPPVKLPLAAEFEVASVGAKTKPSHPEIFRNR